MCPEGLAGVGEGQGSISCIDTTKASIAPRHLWHEGIDTTKSQSKLSHAAFEMHKVEEERAREREGEREGEGQRERERERESEGKRARVCE